MQKDFSIGPPAKYLGGKVRKFHLDNGVEFWAYSSSQYLQEAIKIVKQHLEEQNKRLKNKKEKAALKTDYRPEMDLNA